LSAIRFILNGERVEHRLADPTRTALELLRYDLRRPGTKEGCAEGDCGACTVVIGALAGDDVRYRAVNACILFAAELDGAEVITVEGLHGAKGGLHPVQQAMVETHGSQCGFCTPGFVMALYAHYLSDAPRDRQTLKDAIAGNLCRCTGYGPILAAGERMGEIAPRAEPDRQAAADRLRALRRDAPLRIAGRCPATGAPKRYEAPRTADEFAAMLDAAPEATILAGGTDVGLWVTKQHRRLDHVISITGVTDLNFVRETGEEIVIGAGATYSDLHDTLARHYPDFGELLRRLGAVQVRNSGTMGGNIANGSPIGDSMPPLIALGATLVLRHDDRRREMPLEDYFIDYGRQDRRPGEFVAEIRLPKPHAGLVFHCDKISKRFDQDISAVCSAVALTLADGRIAIARICYGGMAATPKRARHAEAALAGSLFNEDGIRAAMAALEQDYAPISDMRASADYRLSVAKNLLYKSWLRAGAKGGDLRLARADRVEAADG